MKVKFAENAWEDYLYWQKKDKRVLKRINRLIKEIQRDPDVGIGNPEKLKLLYSGYSSRRINREHRIVYKVVDDTVFIAQLRYHY
jgi:toxin YoeB